MVEWINTILAFGRMSVLINGVPCGYFSCSGGFRQGDLLSPLLFCIAEDVVSRAITSAANKKLIKHISFPRGHKCPTHLLHADDLMVFCKADGTSLNTLYTIHNTYAASSGQRVNNNKITIFLGKFTLYRSSHIQSCLGINTGTTPFNNLSIPIFRSLPCKFHLQGILDKVKFKLEGWQGKLLSIAAGN